MKELTWKIVVPVTIISFTVFTKWWFVMPFDAPDKMMYGFPLPYACEGWHTSMSLYIFFLELGIDLFCNFLFWFIIIYCIDRYLIRIKLHTAVLIPLLSAAGVCIASAVFIMSFPDNSIRLSRSFEVEILQTGYQFVWDGYSPPENFNFKKHERTKKSR